MKERAIKMIKLLLLSVMLISTTTATVFADPVVTINLRLKAELVDQSCTVASESQNINVALGTWATNNMLNVGDRTRATPFSIHLFDCKANSVAVSFIGPTDPSNTNYLALNNTATAGNVAIEILDKDRQLLPMGSFSTPENTTNKDSVQLDFFANYISTRGKVTAGTADAVANFVLNYN